MCLQFVVIESSGNLRPLLTQFVDGEDIPQRLVQRRVNLLEVGVVEGKEAQVLITAQDVLIAEVPEGISSCG